jgi:conjugative transposon TraN protein
MYQGGMQEAKVTKGDTVRIRYIHKFTSDDERIFESNLGKPTVIYVNDQVTTHLIMPENIKLVDISTDKLVGNQCADNIVRLKPKSTLMDNELAGTVTSHRRASYCPASPSIYTKAPKRAHSVYTVGQEDIRDYTNPEVSMTRAICPVLCWSIFTSRRKCFRVHGKQYGIRAQVNNIYTVGDYFFIDFSLQNKSNIKYDIAEIRLKLMDKKELKATNSQTIELTPVYMVNHADHFTKSYRNVIVLKKLTFPEEKKLSVLKSPRTRSAAVSAISTSTTVTSSMPTASRRSLLINLQ